MNTLSHKGFIGVFNYIEDEEILFGKIEGVNDLVTFREKVLRRLRRLFMKLLKIIFLYVKKWGKNLINRLKVHSTLESHLNYIKKYFLKQ